MRQTVQPHRARLKEEGHGRLGIGYYSSLHSLGYCILSWIEQIQGKGYGEAFDLTDYNITVFA